MPLSSRIKPISYLKSHAAEISYEQAQEATALLKILALGMRQIEEGKFRPAIDVTKSLSERKKPL